MTENNRWAITCPQCHHRYTWIGPLSPVPPCPKCTKAGQDREKAALDASVKEALSIAEEIESMAADLPEEGEDFGESVAEKAADIAANIKSHNRVTDNQLNALENMRDGLSRWFPD